MGLAGTPAITAPAGASFVTAAPAPTLKRQGKPAAVSGGLAIRA